MLAHNLQDQAIEIRGIAMTSDTRATFDSGSAINAVGGEMAKNCSDKVYKMTGIKPDQIDVVELHDCFSANELCTYEAIGLCPTGKAGEFIDKDQFTYGGKVVVNPSGGLISKGHPLGATGLAQAAELCWQLKNRADDRQVKGAKLALSHNLGLGGACVMTIYEKYNSRGMGGTSDPEKLDKYEVGLNQKKAKM